MERAIWPTSSSRLRCFAVIASCSKASAASSNWADSVSALLRSSCRYQDMHIVFKVGTRIPMIEETYLQWCHFCLIASFHFFRNLIILGKHSVINLKKKNISNSDFFFLFLPQVPNGYTIFFIFQTLTDVNRLIEAARVGLFKSFATISTKSCVYHKSRDGGVVEYARASRREVTDDLL